MSTLKKVTLLTLTDLTWYITISLIFFSSFYIPILDVLEQTYTAINENTQTLTETQNPLTSQISIRPYVQTIINMLILFTIIAVILNLGKEWLKTKILYKKPFWQKTMLIQLGQSILFIALIVFSNYLFYLQLAWGIIPLWLISSILVLIWGIFFWLATHTKAYVIAKKKFQVNSLWISLILTALLVYMASTKIVELIGIALLVWLIGQNWHSAKIATFK